MAGPDPDDGGYLKVALPKCDKTALKQFRIAVKFTDPASEVDGEYADQLQALADKLAKAGAKVKEAAPAIDTARLYDVYIRMLAPSDGRGQGPALARRDRCGGARGSGLA